jgi:hypothetical protein
MLALDWIEEIFFLGGHSRRRCKYDLRRSFWEEASKINNRFLSYFLAHALFAFYITPVASQKSKELGLCETEFNYRMEKRDLAYNKFAEEIRKSVK